MANPPSVITIHKYCLITAALICMLASVYEAQAQLYTNGFYFTVTCSPYTQKPLTITLGSKQSVCITPQPVLLIDSIQAISELFRVEGRRLSFFDVTLSPEAHLRLQKIASGMLLKELVFVVDDEAVFLFDVAVSSPVRVFRVIGIDNPKDVRRIHLKLHKLVTKSQ